MDRIADLKGMKRRFVLILMTTSFLSPTLYSAAEGNDLLQMERDWNDSLKTRNVGWFENNLADDLTDISSANGALHNKSEDIAAIKSDKTAYESLELSDLKCGWRRMSELSQELITSKDGTTQGQSFDVRLAFTDTYIRRNGRWQVWASQHTRVKP
jgi:hypothetical protein